MRSLLIEHGMRVEDDGRRIEAERRKAEEAKRRDLQRRSGGGRGASGGMGQAKVKVKVESKPKEQEKQLEAVMENPLFAYAGRARKIAFAIDISGSMLIASPFGSNRMEVVSAHAIWRLRVIRSCFSSDRLLAIAGQGAPRRCH